MGNRLYKSLRSIFLSHYHGFFSMMSQHLCISIGEKKMGDPGENTKAKNIKINRITKMKFFFCGCVIPLQQKSSSLPLFDSGWQMAISAHDLAGKNLLPSGLDSLSTLMSRTSSKLNIVRAALELELSGTDR